MAEGEICGGASYLLLYHFTFRTRLIKKQRIDPEGKTKQGNRTTCDCPALLIESFIWKMKLQKRGMVHAFPETMAVLKEIQINQRMMLRVLLQGE